MDPTTKSTNSSSSHVEAGNCCACISLERKQMLIKAGKTALVFIFVAGLATGAFFIGKSAMTMTGKMQPMIVLGAGIGLALASVNTFSIGIKAKMYRKTDNPFTNIGEFFLRSLIQTIFIVGLTIGVSVLTPIHPAMHLLLVIDAAYVAYVMRGNSDPDKKSCATPDQCYDRLFRTPPTTA